MSQTGTKGTVYLARGAALVFGGVLYFLARGISMDAKAPLELALGVGFVASVLIFFIWFQCRTTAVTAPAWQKHRRSLSGFWIVTGAIVIGSCLVLLHLLSAENPVSRVISERFSAAGLFVTALFGCFAIATGVGLYRDRTWAKVLVKILAFPYFLGFPIGTTLAIYTWWALSPNRPPQETDQTPRVSTASKDSTPNQFVEERPQRAMEETRVPFAGNSSPLVLTILFLLLAVALTGILFVASSGKAPVSNSQQTNALQPETGAFQSGDAQFAEEYAGFLLGAHQGTVVFNKGNPTHVLEHSSPGPYEGSLAVIAVKDLDKGQTASDFLEWSYDSGMSRINLTFGEDKTLKAIECYSRGHLICPSLFGLQDGSFEETVAARLGKPTSTVPSGTAKQMIYEHHNASFFISDEKVYMIRVGGAPMQMP